MKSAMYFKTPVCMAKMKQQGLHMCIIVSCNPPENQNGPFQGNVEDDFPFPMVVYVSSLEGTIVS